MLKLLLAIRIVILLFCSGLISKAAYTYDSVGNLQAVKYPNTPTNLCQYDTLNRLTGLTWKLAGTTKPDFAYTLGTVGNRLSRTTTGGLASLVPSTSSTYNGNDWLNSDSMDANGNTVQSAGMVGSYDPENRLVNRSIANTSLVYDGDANRVQETVNGMTTYYLVDDRNPTGYAQVLEEWSAPAGGTATRSRTYTVGSDLISQERWTGGSSLVSYYGYDGLGSVPFLTDGAGTVTDTYDYEAFGTLVYSTGTTPNRFLFAGEQYDPVLKHYYVRARTWVPDTGRFATRDTFEGNVSDPLSLHKYLYAEDNPVNRVDPSGHLAESDTLLAVGESFAIEAGANIGANLVRQAAVRTISRVIAGTAIYALSTQTLERTNDFGNVMRLELQDDAQNQDHYWSQVIVNSQKIGVTTRQVRDGLEGMHDAVLADLTDKHFPTRLEPELYSAIIQFSQKLDPVRAAGGVTQAGNVLREKFYDRGREFRIDLENLHGHNLRN